MAAPDNHNIAVFCDFEHIALGIKEANYPDFKIRPVLGGLLRKGSIVVKKAGCGWDRYKEFKRDMQEEAFELIEIPHVRQLGRNSADIPMVADALDLCDAKSHIDTFVVLSGDSDFSPLISKLKENGKSVIGIGVRSSSSSLLISNCDGFLSCEDIVQIKPGPKAAARKPAATKQSGKEVASAPHLSRRRGRPSAEKPAVAEEAEGTPELGLEERKSRAIGIVVGTVVPLVSDGGVEGSIPASTIKNTIKRVQPGFSESEYGHGAFAKILDDANKRSALVAERKEGGAVIVSLPTSGA
ncbi:MAG: NYN domain-containing protein [Thiobacillaceae bacterium]